MVIEYLIKLTPHYDTLNEWPKKWATPLLQNKKNIFPLLKRIRYFMSEMNAEWILARVLRSLLLFSIIFTHLQLITKMPTDSVDIQLHYWWHLENSFMTDHKAMMVRMLMTWANSLQWKTKKKKKQWMSVRVERIHVKEVCKLKRYAFLYL